MSTVYNFNSYEQQSITASASSSAGAFTTPTGIQALDCMIVNYGTAGAQIIFGNGAQTAQNTSGAAGSAQYYVPAGAVMVVNKSSFANYAVITDGPGTNLILHAGSGS